MVIQDLALEDLINAQIVMIIKKATFKANNSGG